MPILLLCHHVIVRAPSSLKLPHELHGWQEVEYVRWVHEHDLSEQVDLIKSSVREWREASQDDQKDKNGEGEEDAKPFVDVLEQLLASNDEA